MKPTKLNSAREVLEALLRGEKVHKAPTTYLSLDAAGRLLCNHLSHECTLAEFNYGMWEIYREPPKPVGFVEAFRESCDGTNMFSSFANVHLIGGELKCRRYDKYCNIPNSSGPGGSAINAIDWLPVEEDES